MDLNKSIRYLKGVGPSREVLFNKLGIFTLKDLLYYFPRTATTNYHKSCIWKHKKFIVSHMEIT